MIAAKAATKEDPKGSAEVGNEEPKIVDVGQLLVNKQFLQETCPIVVLYGRLVLPSYGYQMIKGHSIGFLGYTTFPFQAIHAKEVSPLLPRMLHAELEFGEVLDLESQGIEEDFTKLETITVTFGFRKSKAQPGPNKNSTSDSEYYKTLMGVMMLIQRSTEYCSENGRMFVQEKLLSEATSMELLKKGLKSHHGILETTFEGSKLYISNGWIFRPVSDLIADEKIVKDLADRLASDRAGEEYTDS